MTAVLRAARGIFSVAGLRTSMRGSTVAVRSFSANNAPSGQGHIAGDVEGLVGKARSEAIFKRAFGEEWFEREGTAAFEEGTRENPIPILSTEAERCVGVSLPDDAEIRWFNLRKGELAYDPDTCNFFALKTVTQEEVDAWVARAEAQLLAKQH